MTTPCYVDDGKLYSDPTEPARKERDEINAIKAQLKKERFAKMTHKV